MTPDQLVRVKIGDNVTIRGSKGRVTQVTRAWFMVVWQDGTPEIIRRTPSILTKRLHLDAATQHQLSQFVRL